ncbi:MAG: hypothetical protein AAF804_20045 [Bacteroidota bacterium]
MKEEELNDLQFDILDTIYFVEPLEHILEECDAPRAVIIDELKTMIDRGWVQVMRYDEKKDDFVRTAIFDSDHLEEYSFLATKDGLLRHTGH